MLEVTVFAEDSGHESFLDAYLRLKLPEECGVQPLVHVASASGGAGRAVHELRDFVRDIRAGRLRVPDLLIVAIDANCHTYAGRKQEIEEVASELREHLVCAIPDPHVERWLLLDSHAFKAVLGRGCNAPDQKCDKDRYKVALADAVSQAGLQPLIHGLEHTEDLVREMDVAKTKKRDTSFGKFVDDLNAAIQRQVKP